MEKKTRVRLDGKPYGSPNPKARPRMSKKAELEIHNGHSLKKDDVIVKDELNDGPASAPVTEEDKMQPVIKDDSLLPMLPQSLEGQMTILTNEPPVERMVKISVKLDQIGIKDKDGNLVDANNNTFKTIDVTLTGKNIDIAKVAGRVANDLHDFYNSLAGVKGIKRGAGFNVTLAIEDNSVTADNTINIKSISKVRMSNPVDVAFKVGSALLTQVESDNADNLMTGNFKVGVDGQLLLKKLKFTEASFHLPIFVVKKQMDERRKEINNSIKADKKASTVKA